MTPSQIFWAVVVGVIFFAIIVFFFVVAFFKMKKSIKWGVIFFSALLVVFSGNLIGNLIGDNIDIGSVLLDILLIALVVTLLISSILIWRTREKAKETQKSVDEMNEKIDNLKRIVEEDENDNGDDMK